MKTMWKQWFGGAVAALSCVAVTSSLTAQENQISQSAGDAFANLERANRLIGTQVRAANNNNIGELKDVVVDLESGRVLYGIVSAGGFLGAGERNVAVPPGAFNQSGRRLTLDVNRQKLMNAPQAPEGDRNQLGSVDFVKRVYDHFGQTAWWQGPGSESSRFGNVHRASALDGMNVKNVSDQNIGEIQTLMIDLPAGRVGYVILAPDRELRGGNELIALPPNALTRASDGESLTTDLDRQKLANAPGFQRGDWSEISNRSFASRVYQFFGKEPYFEGAQAGRSASSGQDRADRDNSRSDQARSGSVVRADQLIGRNVRTSENQEIGEIENIIVDLESGRILYAVISAGGFLDIGDRQFAVPPGAFTASGGNRLQINADRQKLTDAPRFSEEWDTAARIGDVSFVRNVYRHFDQNAWWEGPGSPGRFGNPHKAADLIGTEVRNPSNQSVAEVENVMLDLSRGRVVCVILTPDDALDLGKNLYAVPPNLLTPPQQGEALVADLDREKLRSAPHFTDDNWPDLSDQAWVSRVYQHFGKRAYFETGGLRPTSERTNVQERIYHEPNESNE